MTNKNAFEIRADMLKLAKDYMDQQCQINIEFAQKMFEQGNMTFEEAKNAAQLYDMEELMDKAREMYSFVSKRD